MVQRLGYLAFTEAARVRLPAREVLVRVVAVGVTRLLPLTVARTPILRLTGYDIIEIESAFERSIQPESGLCLLLNTLTCL